MKIKFKTSVSHHNFSYHKGKIVDIDNKLAKIFVQNGIAEEIIDSKTAKNIAEKVTKGLKKREVTKEKVGE